MDKILIYQMLPRLWGRGRLSDVDMATLSYIKSLGMDYIWYTGIPRHASGETFTKGNIGSPYAISDYYDVNPYLADVPENRMSEMDSLIERTHAAGLKVIIDFVPNHVAPNYSDPHGGIRTFDYCDYDWTDTRKIDYGDRGNWDRMRDILLFWAGKGIDGFRCDMVEMVPIGFFRWLTTEVKSVYPELIFIAEVYTRSRYGAYIHEAGFDLLYDKSGSYDILRGIMTSGGPASAITDNWLALGELQSNMLNFLENHDEQRLASRFFIGNAERSYAALAVSLLLNGASFMLYFAQEVGEEADGTPSGRTSIFDLVKVPGAHELYRYIHTGKGLSKRRAQVLDRYGYLLSLASTPLFRRGRMFDLCYCSGFDRSIIHAFARGDGERSMLVAVNFSASEVHVKVTIPHEAVEYLAMKNAAPEGGVGLDIPPFGAVVTEI